jgi:hypothetical protein
MTLHDIAEGFRRRAEIKGICPATTEEEYNDDERLVAAYLYCPWCEGWHLSAEERAALLPRIRTMGDVSEILGGYCPRPSLD